MASNSDIIKIGFDYKDSLEKFLTDYDGTMNQVQKSADGKRIEIKFDVSDKDVINKISSLQGEFKDVRIELNGKALSQQLQSVDDIKTTLISVVNLINKGADLSSLFDFEVIASKATKAADTIKNDFSSSADSIKSDFERLKTEIAEVENAYNKIKRNKLEEQESRYVDRYSGDYVDLSGYDSVSQTKENFEYLESKLKEIYALYNNVKSAIDNNNGWFNGYQYDSSDLNQMIFDFKSLAQAYYELDPSQMNKSMKEIADSIGLSVEKVKTLKQVIARMSDEFKGFVVDVIADSDSVKANNKAFNEETQQLISENEQAVSTYVKLKDQLLSKIADEDTRNKISDYIPYIDTNFPDFSYMPNFGDMGFGDKINVLTEMCKILGIEIPQAAEESKEAINNINNVISPASQNDSQITNQEKLQSELKETEIQAEQTVKAIKDVNSQDPKKDAFQADTNPVEKIVDNFKEAKQETEKATESAKDYIRTLSQVGEWNVDSKVSVIKQKNDGQLESWNYDAKRGKKNITYDKYGNIDYGDPIITTISNYKQLEQTIIKADNELRDLQKTLKDVKETSPNASTKNIEKQIQYQEEYISLLEQTIKTISHGDEYFLHEQQIIDARKKAETEYNLKQGTKSDISDAKRDAKSAKEAQIEAENIKLAQQKEIYNQLNDALDRYSTVSKTIANGKGLESDYEEAARLQEKIEELQNHPILSQEQLDAAQRKLDKIEQTIEDIETHKSDKAWGDAIAENNKRDAKSAKEEAKNIQAEWNENVKAIQDYMDAVTKLNNLQASDKGTGSKTNEIEDQKNKVEEFKEKALEARTVLSSMVDPHWGSIDTWDDWIAAMEKLDQAAYGSSESIAKLKDSLKAVRDSQMKQLQNSIEKYNGILENASQYKTPNTNYQNQLTKFQTAINGLKTYKETLSGVTPLTEEQKAKIAELTAECDKCAKAFKNMSAAEKGSNERSRMKEADKITKYLQQNTRLSKEAKKQLESYVNLLRSSDADVDVGKIHTEWLKVTDAERAAGREGKSFFDVVKEKAWYGAASAIGTYFGFNDIMRYGQQAIQTIVSLDDEMVDLKKTTSMSSSQLEDFYYDSNNVAKQMGATTQEIIDQASAWSRLGYNTKDASTEMAKLSSQFASISPGMATDEAQEGLVSIMKAWQIDPDQVKSEIMDPINQLGNTMAESNQDIVEGMKRSAAALAAVGTDVKDSFALFSSIQEVLQNSEKSGTSLRSVALRLRSFDESTEEYSEDLANITGELADLTKTAEHSQGVSIFKPGSTTEFKSLVDYFGEIHDIWDEMSQKQQNDFLLKAFGRTQAQAGAALIQNYDAVTKAIQEMEQASGSSDKEMSTVESSISYKINALKQTWVGTAQEILKRDDIGNFVTALTKLSEGLGSLVSNLGLVKTAALGISAALSLNNVGELKLY